MPYGDVRHNEIDHARLPTGPFGVLHVRSLAWAMSSLVWALETEASGFCETAQENENAHFARVGHLEVVHVRCASLARRDGPRTSAAVLGRKLDAACQLTLTTT